MLTAEAQIETERPSRYLVQLCRHAAAMTGAHGHRPGNHAGTDGHRPGNHAGADGPPAGDVRVHAEWSDTRGVIDFAPRGRCTIRAGAGTLTLRVEAADEAALHRIQDVIARDIGRFGRRDQLTVSWYRPGPPGREPAA
jgi:hypothetical protein